MADEADPNTFGWDLLYSLYEKHFTNKLNVIVAWAHFNLLKRGFKNAGIGVDTTLPAQKELKETLPYGWHDQLPCRMRYYYDKKLYLLTIQDVDEDGDVIINLNRPCDNQVAVTTMSLEEVVKLTGRLEEIMPQWNSIMQRIGEDIISPLVTNQASKDIQVQTEGSDVSREEEPARYRTPADIPLPIPPRISFVPPGLGIGGVGRADLDPLGGGGGGMLFQPPGMGPRPFMPDPLLPRGSLPPGARFDPIMPGRGGLPPMPDGARPRPFPRAYPDPDHLPPPGYDDMFS